jgi:hypothetical protein
VTWLQGIFRPVPRRAFLGLVALNVVFRIYLATLPGYLTDIQDIRDWGLGAALWGISQAYEMTPIDYPPLILYVLAPAGHVYLSRHPELRSARVRLREWGEHFFTLEDGTVYRSWEGERRMPIRNHRAKPLPEADLLSFLVKLSLNVFDLLLGGLLVILVARGLWGPDRSGLGWGRLAALFYLWNPAVLFDVSYWAQSDSIHTLFVVAALASLGAQRMLGSGILLALAGLMKPLAAPLVPLFVLTAALRKRWKGLLLMGAGALGTAVLILLPFMIAGNLTHVLGKVIGDIDVMPYTSVNGHSLWWILGPWEAVDARVLGPLTPKTIGLLLVLAYYAVLLFRSRRWIAEESSEASDFPARIFLLGAAMTSGFFFLSTHMHENHLFMAIPMLIAVAGRSRQLMQLALLCSAVAFLNMIVHDEHLPYLLPGRLGTPTDWGRHMTHWAQNMLHSSLTPVQLVLSYSNALAAGVVFIWSFRAAMGYQPASRGTNKSDSQVERPDTR